MRFVGSRSAARASASSGVCLYLKLSNAPGAGAGPDLAGFEEEAGAVFLASGAVAAGADGVLAAGDFCYIGGE